MMFWFLILSSAAYAEIDPYFAVSNAFATEADQASIYPENSPSLQFCDGKRKLWVVEAQKEFICSKEKYGFIKLKPGFLEKNDNSAQPYAADVKLVTAGSGRSKMPLVRNAHPDEVLAAKDLATQLLKKRKKTVKGKEQVYGFDRKHVQVTELSGGRKAMLFPSILFLTEPDYENCGWYGVALFDKGSWTLSPKLFKVYNNPIDERDGVTFVADLNGKGWPAIRYRITLANSMEVEYAQIYPAVKTVATFKSEGPTD